MKKLYIVSIGPGDPELLTLKAYKTIQKSDAVCIPTKSENSFDKSRTYEIIKEATNHAQRLIPIYTPMKLRDEDWLLQIEAILGAFEESNTVSYVTLGDAGVYSTAYYLLERIKETAPNIYENIEVIPGVTSFSLASAKAKIPLCLGDETLNIRPFADNEQRPATTVYMRPEKKNRNSPDINGNALLFQKLSMEGEIISPYSDATSVDEYMSLLIDFAPRL